MTPLSPATFVLDCLFAPAEHGFVRAALRLGAHPARTASAGRPSG